MSSVSVDSTLRAFATVWLNGKLVGGWPYGYNSFRLDLTPHVIPGGVNQLAIRLDNPAHSARWYPGGGLYRNVWLTRTNRVHVGHWGTQVTTPQVSKTSATVDVISLNYQGSGIRSLPGQFPAFHAAFPDKVILHSESAAALSSRGEYQFPVSGSISGPVRPGSGGDPKTRQVSAYELHAADFGSSADRAFASLDQNPYVAGEFIWSGWDYLGEPTPYYSSRSSYYGIIDLAGFKKDRFYIYQARWRPELPMAHLLPHWTWPGREGEVTPVHLFTSGDEAELFVNGKSQGRKKKAQYEYRLRWDYVTYEPGELRAVAYKNGKEWATAVVRTASAPAKLELTPDRARIRADGSDLSFVTLRILDANGVPAPAADDLIRFSIEGPGEIVATDNGDPTSFVPFQSPQRKAFNGLCLVIVRGTPGDAGKITLRAQAPGLQSTSVVLNSTR